MFTLLLISAMVNGVISDGVTLLLHDVKLDFLSAQLSWIFSFHLHLHHGAAA